MAAKGRSLRQTIGAAEAAPGSRAWWETQSISLNAQTEPPWLKLWTILATSPPHSGTAPPQPETPATYCSPSCSPVIGEPTTPEPVLYFQSTSPVVSSTACR